MSVVVPVLLFFMVVFACEGDVDRGNLCRYRCNGLFLAGGLDYINRPKHPTF